MKRLITIITLFASTLVYAEETKTANELLVEGFNALTVTDTTLTSKAKNNALKELRTAYYDANTATAETYATSMLTALEADPTTAKCSWIVMSYVMRNDLLSTISIKVATAIGLQPQWFNKKGVTYDTLKASNFVYDNVKVISYIIYGGILKNKDYATAKSYPAVLFMPFAGGGITFITGYLLDMTDSTTAYEESKFWENVALKGNSKNKASVLKKIQDVQDILYLRVTRDNKIQ